MMDATCKNKLYLSGEVWNGFWSRILNLFSNAAKALPMVTLRLKFLRLNNSIALCGVFLGDNSFI
jgi:hypothetical protein